MAGGSKREKNRRRRNRQKKKQASARRTGGVGSGKQEKAKHLPTLEPVDQQGPASGSGSWVRLALDFVLGETDHWVHRLAARFVNLVAFITISVGVAASAWYFLRRWADDYSDSLYFVGFAAVGAALATWLARSRGIKVALFSGVGVGVLSAAASILIAARLFGQPSADLEACVSETDTISREALWYPGLLPGLDSDQAGLVVEQISYRVLPANGASSCVEVALVLRNAGPVATVLNTLEFEVDSVARMDATCVGGMGGDGGEPLLFEDNYDVEVVIEDTPTRVRPPKFARRIHPGGIDDFLITMSVQDQGPGSLSLVRLQPRLVGGGQEVSLAPAVIHTRPDLPSTESFFQYSEVQPPAPGEFEDNIEAASRVLSEEEVYVAAPELVQLLEGISDLDGSEPFEFGS